jgi:integrase
VRPEEAFGADWGDVDLEDGVLRVRRAFAKGRLKRYTKTERSRRRLPLRAKVVKALEELPRREGVLFANSVGGRIDINNWRSREWVPALDAAGVEHRRIYDMRHTFATWSLAAGMSIFTLSRRMGTSVQMIDQTYGHLARDADDYDRGLLDAYDRRRRNLGT